MTMRVSKDRIDMDDKVLQKPVLKDYGETVVTANSGTSYTIDLTTGNVFNITLTGNCAFTFANPPASGTAGSFTLILTQDATGTRIPTWPAAVAWLGGIGPILTATSIHSDVLIFATLNGGIAWYGTLSAQNYNAYIPVYIPYGYFGGGGFSPSTVSIINRIDYASDTSTAAVKGPLSLARYRLAAVGNSSFGYFGGGAPGPVSRVDRIDYSSDTSTAVVKGPLSATTYGLAAAGNSVYGYFGGATGGRSTVGRLDYNSDTSTTAVKGPLSLARGRLAATGNSSYGYFGGGESLTTTRVDRIDYNNDTATATVKGPLSAGRYAFAATGTFIYGYFGGGQTPQVSLIDRIDYSSDTSTAVAKGPLSLARSYVSASGNSSFGYFAGGLGGTTLVDRIDYANDTAVAAAKGPLSAARYQSAGTNHNPV